jgi:hypothetical protein
LVLRLAACAVVGAMVTVAVAWGAYRYSRPAEATTTTQGPVDWVVTPPPGWPDNAMERTMYVGFAQMHTASTHWPGAWPEDGAYDESIARIGWPWLALYGVDHHHRGPGKLLLHLDISPTVPMWPGFALNTVFYGAIVFVLWTEPGFVRRRRRRRRGLCAGCGYELKGLERCPECGGEGGQGRR